MANLQFKGKEFVHSHHLEAPFFTLKADEKKGLSKKPSLDDNLIIHGDNLVALKALLPTHAGKVKCVYIDPPYNTGNEKWVYNDNVASPLIKDWLGKVVDREDLTRHDKWLCMMMPRLKLLWELLRDDGVIFISIDDNEVHHLRMLMDEIFGEDNFVAQIIWQKKYAASNDAKYFSDNHDYIIVYAKQKGDGGGFSLKLLPRSDKQDSLYKYDDNDGRGLWRSDNLTVKTYSKEYDYAILNPLTKKEYWPTKGRAWATNRETMVRWIAENRIFFGQDGKGAPQLKRYLNEVQAGIVPLTIWSYEDVGHTDEARKYLKSIFSESDLPFDNPKPIRLIQRMLQLSSSEDDVVLDSFAGSGTTAHAVLAQNKEDGGNRRFILVEMEDYADKITAKRVRRVSKGVKTAKDENLKTGLGGTFSYFTLGKELSGIKMLTGEHLPSVEDLAGHLFYTATLENFDAKKIKPIKTKQYKQGGVYFIGSSAKADCYLVYEPNLGFLKSAALTEELCDELPKPAKGKKRMVFAPVKYLESKRLVEKQVEFVRYPLEF